MKIKELTFLQFAELNEAERAEYQEICLNCNRYNIDCKELTFGQVKDLQHELSQGAATFATIREVLKIYGLDIEAIPVHVSLGMFRGICDSIREISELEANNLAGRQDPEVAEAIQIVGGFEAFETFPQLDALAGGDPTKYEAVRSLPYNDCFAKLYYDKKVTDFQTEITKIRNRK
jgi:hypothetical protein